MSYGTKACSEQVRVLWQNIELSQIKSSRFYYHIHTVHSGTKQGAFRCLHLRVWINTDWANSTQTFIIPRSKCISFILYCHLQKWQLFKYVAPEAPRTRRLEAAGWRSSLNSALPICSSTVLATAAQKRVSTQVADGVSKLRDHTGLVWYENVFAFVYTSCCMLNNLRN